MKKQEQEIEKQRFIFIMVTILVISLVIWWISIQIQQSQALLQSRIHSLKAGRAEAWLFDSNKILPFYREVNVERRFSSSEGIVAEMPNNLPSRQQRIQDLNKYFPNIKIVAKPVAFDDPQLLDLEGAYLTLDQNQLKDLEAQSRSIVWKAALQSGFLALGVLGGFTLIYKKLNQELDFGIRQQNFLAAITHELKTPIASIRVWIDTILKHDLEPSLKDRAAIRMDQDLTRLSTLVGDLLDSAKIESGTFDYKPGKVDLSDLVTKTCSNMDQRLGQGELGLVIEINSNIFIKADPENIVTVVENILTNAYKYANSPRNTNVYVRTVSSRAIVMIEDAGFGVENNNLTKIFQKFFRAGDELIRRASGTGLGLYIAKELVERNNGTIKVESKGVNQGTAFILTFPLLQD